MLLSFPCAAIIWALTFAAAQCHSRIAPKVLIVTFFDDEGNVYLNNSDQEGGFNLTAQRHRIPFGNPQFPYLHCTSDDAVCLVTLGEGMIHASASTMALLADPMLDLRKTYWVLTGIAGGAPDQVTLNSITLARFSVQATMQHEIDAREIPSSFETGYFPQGTSAPGDDWGYVYNTEVFELNTNLRDLVGRMIDPSKIVDIPGAASYRARYAIHANFTAGASPPTVRNCDVVTADTWWTGTLLADSFADRVRRWTNGTGVYCTTAQEDGAVLGALVRGALEERVDYSRIIVVRTVSDFDRPFPGQSAIDNLLFQTGAYSSAVENVYVAGHSIASGITGSWDEIYAAGVAPDNYIGDVWATLGNTPDFGPGRVSSGIPVVLPGASHD
ncbi:purine nucleoside permease [Xylariomycetidae sp. FL2044]|nr:purine nucleoside permease [Xylariomycetidae sp. FL2044]